MKSRISTSPNRDGNAVQRFFSLGLQNPVFRYGAWILFILLVIRLTYVGFPGLPVPQPGSKATNYYVAPRALTCEKPNPALETEMEKAKEQVSPYYSVDKSYFSDRKLQLRTARDRLVEAFDTMNTVERKIRANDRRKGRNDRALRKSPFYKAAEPEEVASSGSEKVSREETLARLEKSREEIREYVLGIIHVILPNPRSQGHVAIYEALKADPTLIPALFDAVAMNLDEVDDWLIVETYDVNFDRDRARGIVLVVDGQRERHLKDSDQLYSYSNAIQTVRSDFQRQTVRQNFPRLARNTVLSGFAEELVLTSLRSNLRKDERLTQRALQQVLKGLPKTVPVEFSQSQTIVALGETVVPWQAQCVAKFSSHSGGGKGLGDLMGVPISTLFLLLGITLLALVSAFILKRFASRFVATRELSDKDYLAIAVLLVLHLSLIRLFLFFAGILTVSYPELGRATLLTACPVALAPMVLNILMGPRVSLLGTLFLLVMTSMIVLMSGPEMLSGNFPGYSTLYMLMVSLVGIWVTRHVARRGAYVLAGGAVGLAGVGFWIIVLLLEGGQVPTGHSLQLSMASVISGAFTYIFLMSLTPIFEYVWDYTTDSRLVELASTDHEALKELSREAPGTYQHSMWIATLVEDAAEAIGANALLSRVGAYYHDLGKLVAHQEKDNRPAGDSPLFFAENQSPGSNPHDHLPAKVSARIIKRHVAQSTQMIRKYRLGKMVHDLAEQHHGTTFLEHFYNKALLEAKETGESVDQRDFRYPGPKPQSKEAALLMLADSIEAAVRALPQHTEESITGRVEEIFNRRIQDGQLDESGMTFGDVGVAQQSFVKTLVSMYHARPEYLKAKQDEQTVRLKRDELLSEDEDTLEVDGKGAADAPTQPRLNESVKGLEETPDETLPSEEK